MATVYKIEIQMASPFVNYKEEYIKDMFEKFIKEITKPHTTQPKFEDVEIKVERIA